MNNNNYKLYTFKDNTGILITQAQLNKPHAIAIANVFLKIYLQVNIYDGNGCVYSCYQ